MTSAMRCGILMIDFGRRPILVHPKSASSGIGQTPGILSCLWQLCAGGCKRKLRIPDKLVGNRCNVRDVRAN